MKKLCIALGACIGLGMIAPSATFAKTPTHKTCSADKTAISYTCKRPVEKDRLFRSEAVEREIAKVKKLLKNKKLAWMSPV